jgi:hypothetical protein
MACQENLSACPGGGTLLRRRRYCNDNATATRTLLRRRRYCDDHATATTTYLLEWHARKICRPVPAEELSCEDDATATTMLLPQGRYCDDDTTATTTPIQQGLQCAKCILEFWNGMPRNSVAKYISEFRNGMPRNSSLSFGTEWHEIQLYHECRGGVSLGRLADFTVIPFQICTSMCSREVALVCRWR